MLRSVTRRDFVTTVAAGVAATSFGHQLESSAFAQEKPVPDDISIIDTHQHLWDLNKFKLAWHTDPSTKPLQKSFLTSDYLEATKGLNIVKTVYMEVDVVPEQQLAEVAYVTDLCERKDNPMAAAVVSGRPGSAEFEPYAKKLSENKYI